MKHHIHLKEKDVTQDSPQSTLRYRRVCGSGHAIHISNEQWAVSFKLIMLCSEGVSFHVRQIKVGCGGTVLRAA